MRPRLNGAVFRAPKFFSPITLRDFENRALRAIGRAPLMGETLTAKELFALGFVDAAEAAVRGYRE